MQALKNKMKMFTELKSRVICKNCVHIISYH